MIGVLEPVEVLHFLIISRVDWSVLCLNRSDFSWLFCIADKGLCVGLLIRVDSDDLCGSFGRDGDLVGVDG